MDWDGDEYDGCFLYCTLQRPYGGDESHSGRHVARSGAPCCITPSVIGAIRTCRDIFDKLYTAADHQASSCTCCNSIPRYQRECYCCREPPPRYQLAEDVCICDDDATTTSSTTSSSDEDEVVQKTDKATSALTLQFGGGRGGGQSIASFDLTNERAFETAFSELEPFQQPESKPVPDPVSSEPTPEPVDQSKTTVVRRVPCKHKKKTSKCRRCKQKKNDQPDDKSKSLCQCPPMVIFDCPPAKRNFFDFLKCLLPRSNQTGTKTTPGGEKKRLLCACGKEVQPFFGYAELEKRKTETSSEEGKRRSSKRLGTDKTKIGTLEECTCAEADSPDAGPKPSRRSKQKKHRAETLSKREVSGSHVDSCKTVAARSNPSNNEIPYHTSKRKQDRGRNPEGNDQSANGLQVPGKESENKTLWQAATRKSSLEQPVRRFSNPKKVIPILDVDENEGSLCNLHEHWEKQGGTSKVERILNTNKSSSDAAGDDDAKEGLRTVTFRRREQFGGFGAAPMSASYLMFQATYTYRFQNGYRRCQMFFRERRFEDENNLRAIQTWTLKAETRHTKDHKCEDYSENKQMRPYTHPYDLKAIFRLFEEHKRQQPEFRDRERKVLCRKLREKLSRKLSEQRRNRCEGLCVICFSYIAVYINVIVYIIIVIYSLLYVCVIR
nr:unnamed protein product [Callosobruchus chinensis]